MWSPRKGIVPLLCAGVLLGGMVVPAFAQQNALEKEIQELNRITGKKVILERYKMLLKAPKQSKELFRHAVALLKKDKDGLNYNAALILAEAAEKLNQATESARFYRTCTRIAAKLESTRKIVQAYGGLIGVLYESGKYGESAKVCKELLQLETGEGKPRIVLIPVETRLGTETFMPSTEYDAVRGLKPGVMKLLIQALAKDGKQDRALKLADNLIRIQDHWRERQLRAWVLREAGKFKEAAEGYEDVLRRVKSDTDLEEKERDVYEDQLRYLLSNVYVDLEKIDLASKHLQTLIDRHPDEPGYHNDLGYIWADRGLKLAEAERLIRRAVTLDREQRKKIKNLPPEIDKDNGAYLDSLGWVLYKQKKYKEAKEWLLKAVADKSSQHIEIYDHLGDVHMALGERDAAIAAWQRGIEVAGPQRREQERKKSVRQKIDKHSR